MDEKRTITITERELVTLVDLSRLGMKHCNPDPGVNEIIEKFYDLAGVWIEEREKKNGTIEK